MKKRFLALILTLCAILALLAACGEQEPTKTPLSTADAVQIVLEDLDMAIDEANPHVHPGDFQGTACFYVYVTVDGENMAYAVDQYSGQILNIAKSDHSH